METGKQTHSLGKRGEREGKLHVLYTRKTIIQMDYSRDTTFLPET